ncbi:MAG: glutamine--fructose-6-phosphate transaminase (isomerizing) [Candidatus Methanoperedenaceae archaeon]|nr:MAG: glutamine--fructose-6-phosphate transaminase (isomerizing) [Candidatus Methanoperedenaceae archaeon]
MCGIVGYVGTRSASPILIDALKRLEYRGYDSAGLAILTEDGISICKTEGKISDLELKLPRIEGTCGIGHTRWATQGAPTTINAHPHVSGNIAVVHNGIIENYQELYDWLKEEGYEFVSETDTEVLAHLAHRYYKGDLVKAVIESLKKVKGSYAAAYICSDSKAVVAARKESPLVAAVGKGENFIASDVTALLKNSRDVIYMQDFEVVRLTGEDMQFFDFNGDPVQKKIETIEWNIEAAEKSGYPHFMLKEIHEQVTSVHDTLLGRISELSGEVILGEVTLSNDEIRDLDRIVIIACGTSYNAGLLGRYLFESMAGIHTDVEISSEFRYANPVLSGSTLVIAISQSGETADTIAATREAKTYGCHTLAITNVVGTTLSREVQNIVYTRAGPEIGVAATKTFTSQLIALYLLSIYFARKRKKMDVDRSKRLLVSMKQLPGMIQQILNNKELIKKQAIRFSTARDYFFLGRSLNFPIALEGALKLKEISYIHAEGYAAGELKHGPLALISKETPVLALATRSSTYDKMVNNIKEVKARSAQVIAIACMDDTEIEKYVDAVIRVPIADELLYPVLSSVVVQLLAYNSADALSCPIDKPRNLAKSVTVE